MKFPFRRIPRKLAFRVASRVFLFLLLLPSAAPCADLFLAEEPEVYAAIDKLNALGFFPRFPANTRPYPIQAVRSAAGSAFRLAPAEGFETDLLRWLSAYVSPKQMGRLTGAAAHADSRIVPPNSEGIPVPKGWSGRASVSAREQTTTLVNGQVRFLSFLGEGGDDGNRLLDTFLEIGYPYLALRAGKISTWYGPGRRGALLFTSNAEPYLGVRIHNPEPILPGGNLSFLGGFRYDLFAARMEKKERFSHSILVGTRLAFRPGGFFEIGFSRALHYDGKGGANGLSELYEGYFGKNDGSDRSNSLYGFDVTLSLPFAFQPVQAYWERAGENSGHLGRIFLPWEDRWGNIYGLYFPRVLRFSRLDLRVEYADTFSGIAKDDNWYGHASYPHRYRGQILGHAMGGSARDWFVESRYYLRPDASVSLSWESVLRDGADAKGERRTVVSAGLVGWLTASLRGEARVDYDHVTDEGGVPGSDGTDVRAFLGLSYQMDQLLPPDEREVPIREIQGVTQ